jgi:hypothetical protein
MTLELSPARLPNSLCPGAYVTDGIRLYRVVANLFDPWRGLHTAELEDCLTLESELYPPSKLGAMRLTLVREA